MVEACRGAGDLDSLTQGAVAAIRRFVPFDACGLRVADPETMLWTSAYVEGPPGLKWRFIENEVLDDDFLKFASLARGGIAGTLSHSTKGDLTRSRRYRTILSCNGLGDELRAALVAGDACWGTLCLARSHESGTFTTDECRLVAAMAPSLARLLRATLIGAAHVTIPEGPPGTVLVAADGSISALTPPAVRWLSAIGSDADQLPAAARAVVARARAQAATAVGEQCELAASARTRGRDGSWFELHASPLSDSSGTISVTISPAPTGRIAPLLLASFDLSEREGEILTLLIQGMSTDQIASRLFISRHTVRDHTKAIFGKARVSSRPELVARVLATAEAGMS